MLAATLSNGGISCYPFRLFPFLYIPLFNVFYFLPFIFATPLFDSLTSINYSKR